MATPEEYSTCPCIYHNNQPWNREGILTDGRCTNTSRNLSSKAGEPQYSSGIIGEPEPPPDTLKYRKPYVLFEKGGLRFVLPATGRNRSAAGVNYV